MSSTKRAGTRSTSRSRSGSKKTDLTSQQQLARWIGRGFTGCGFAQSFAKGNRLALGSFAGMASPQELEQLRLLSEGGRWRVAQETVKDLVTDDMLVRLEWTTASGMTSMPMGFGPFPQMPVTRRAPYVCIATWPGEHENPHRKKCDNHRVDFLDAATAEPLTKQQYDTLWAKLW